MAQLVVCFQFRSVSWGPGLSIGLPAQRGSRLLSLPALVLLLALSLSLVLSNK